MRLSYPWTGKEAKEKGIDEQQGLFALLVLPNWLAWVGS
jgi:hypothetical protein